LRISASLHRIGSDIVAAYLVEEAGLVTVVDAGLPGFWSDMVDELAAMGRSLDDVRAVVLTHGDSDHRGFAERLRRERGLPVLAHEREAALARGEATKRAAWGRMRPAPTLGFLAYSLRKLRGVRIPPIGEIATFGDGATLDVPGAPRVIALPGHTPGSVGYHVPSLDAVFVGDALTTRNVLTGEPGPAPAPFTADRALALVSLDRIAALDARRVLPGHGPPWEGGTAEAIRRVRVAASRLEGRVVS
jgi:glyoxylase-like metal-dependent hydrolase (beta-lactamase superfamily II)